MKTIEIYFEGVLIKSLEFSKDDKFQIVDFGDGYVKLIVNEKTISHVPLNHLVIFNSKQK